MSSGYCDRCGDASNALHLCVPPFLDRAPTNHSSVHLLPPPRITTQEANAVHVAALEAENARLRRMLARVVDEYARDAWNERSTTRAEVDAWIAALAQDESCTG